MTIDDFYIRTVGFSPNPLQRKVWEAYAGDPHPAILIRAGTGTGKTEAALLPALAHGDSRPTRIILVLPSKALIEDMNRRVIGIGERFTQGNGRTLAVTADMGGSCRRTVCRSGRSHPQDYLRHLFVDDVIITTLDKFLFRMFGYGEKIKSFIFPHRVFGSTIEKQPFVIFDEAHDYEGLAFSNFGKLLQAIYLKGKALCVMSATLPSDFAGYLQVIDAMEGELAERQALFQRERLEMFHPEKCLTLVPAPNTSANVKDDFIGIMEREVRKRYAPSKRIIVRCETVGDLIALHDRLQDFASFIYHGRLTAAQRRAVIGNLIALQRSNDGFLVLATSAIEAGCDLDAHLIVTELCNPDSLVQLAGRLNRRGRIPGAELVVVGDGIKPFASSIGGKDPQQQYIEDLHAMDCVFKPDILKKYFTPARGDWMGEVLFDMLWDYVLEGDLTCKPLWDRGILITRSWIPSVTLCTGLHPRTLAPENPVQVGINRLVWRTSRGVDELKKEPLENLGLSIESNGEWHAELKRVFFNLDRGEDARVSLYPFDRQRMSGYQTSFLCIIGAKYRERYFHEKLGYIRIPKLLMQGYRKGFERTLGQPKIHKLRLSGEKKYPEFAGSFWLLERDDAGNSDY